jgi:hypothetical protein
MLTYADVHVGHISLKSARACVRVHVCVCVRARSFVCVVCVRVHMHNRHLCVPKKKILSHMTHEPMCVGTGKKNAYNHV